MSNEQKPLPVVAWVELNNDHVNFQYGPDAPPFAEDWTALTPHAEAQHAIDCMEAKIDRLTAGRDAALADAKLLREALVIAEAGLADIGDADREPGDDLAWCESRAAAALPTARAALAATAETRA